MSIIAPPAKIAFLGNFTPRKCGIATFTHDIYHAIIQAAPDADCYVTAVTDCAESYDYPESVKFSFQEKDLHAYRQMADALNFKNPDVLCVQHEFGIYGGACGSYLLLLLRELRMPIITTLHTILETPTKEQYAVMEDLTRLSDRLIVMSHKGSELLQAVYGVATSKIDIIPHGIPDLDLTKVNSYKTQLGIGGRRVLLTFGLIGPGKGIEYAIQALPAIIKRHPDVVYLVLGATHPKLLAEDGERYRLDLIRLAEQNKVENHIIFYNRFVSIDDLKEFIGAADIYVTPYLDKSQITSGTLAYAFGAGKAVVSTPYSHAEELLAEGRGALVPFKDAPAIANAICNLLDHPREMKMMQQNAYAEGRKMIWPAVASQYLESFDRAREDRQKHPRQMGTRQNRPKRLPSRQLGHIVKMSDRTGIFQHAIFNVPNFHEGYCVDDNARAYILCILLAEQEHTLAEQNLDHFTSTYLAFLSASLDMGSGRFRNFMSYQREWLEHAGSEDSHGRSLWATGMGAARAPNDGYRRLSAQLFNKGLEVIESFTSPRSWAFAIIGIDEYLNAHPTDQKVHAIAETLSRKIIALWHAQSDESWQWFEHSLTYENARLCEALIRIGRRNQNSEALEIGLQSLEWLASIQMTQNGCFRPIGSNGFYDRKGERADFDQQPVEAQAMIAACNVAYYETLDTKWLTESKRAFDWFLGRNDLNCPLYDYASGGCSDGLHVDRVNENQGAESTLAFHLSLSAMNDTELETSILDKRIPLALKKS